MSTIFEDHVELVHRYLMDPCAAWCVATFGAIAEFCIEDNERVRRSLSEDGGCLVSERGALRISLAESARVVPYETLSQRKNHWLHGINFCLPEVNARMAGRNVLSELGEDENAINPAGQSNILFDLGLDIGHMDICVRTSDYELVKLLRSNIGNSFSDPSNPSMGAIKEASPERVFKSKLGRIEVFQLIGSTAKNIPTPPGPHTHVLPRLLEHKRTHDANVYMPKGFIPSFGLFPPNPIFDDNGKPKPFDHKAFNFFQDILARYGDQKLEEAKAQAQKSVRMGENPPLPDNLDRAARTAVRIGLRQLYRTDGESKILSEWTSALENNGCEPDESHMGNH